MKTIAIIKKNTVNFDQIEKFAAPLLYIEHTDGERQRINDELDNYIWSMIEPYVEFISVSVDDLVTVACEQLVACFPEKSYDDFFYHTEGSYSFPKKYIEFIYAQPMWKEYTENQSSNMNNLGCLFSLKHHVIENSCIILANKYDLAAAHFTILESVTKKDIIKVIRRRFFFSAVLIKKNSMVKYYYQNPVYLMMKIYNKNESDPIQSMPCSLLKYNLLFYFNHDKNQYINQIATRINGLYQLHGDVLLLHELEDKIYANLTIHEAKRLNVLSYGRLYDRQLKNEEIHTIKTTDIDEKGKECEKETTPYWSKYIVIESRMKKWQQIKNLCINCNKTMLNPITCNKCYRVKYCSRSCIAEFASYHDDECINPKSLHKN